MRDPDVIQALMDPQVLAAFNEIMRDPSAAAKYRDNPKFVKLFQKLRLM